MELILREVENNVTIIALDGGLDTSTLPALTEAVEKLVAVGITRVILDCQNLRFISSAGIGALVMLHRKMRQRGGDIKVAAARGPVFQVIELMHLSAIFDVYPDVPRAQLSYRPPRKPPEVSPVQQT